ncbi:MAG: uncharacterized protein A8A55_1723 [Amphiamblys sp. WSBS2006]|nr:MAG: uncharacterized protein A8A55_1723 [Amphiamblys sp. WSBS2006]
MPGKNKDGAVASKTRRTLESRKYTTAVVNKRPEILWSGRTLSLVEKTEHMLSIALDILFTTLRVHSCLEDECLCLAPRKTVLPERFRLYGPLFKSVCLESTGKTFTYTQRNMELEKWIIAEIKGECLSRHVREYCNGSAQKETPKKNAGCLLSGQNLCSAECLDTSPEISSEGHDSHLEEGAKSGAGRSRKEKKDKKWSVITKHVLEYSIMTLVHIEEEHDTGNEEDRDALERFSSHAIYAYSCLGRHVLFRRDSVGLLK